MKTKSGDTFGPSPRPFSRVFLIAAAVVVSLVALISTSERATAQESCDGPRYATDHILVKMKEAAPPESIEKMQALNGEGFEREFFPNYWVVDLPAGLTVVDAIALYSVYPGVDYAEPDPIVMSAEGCAGSEASLELGLASGPDPITVGEKLTYAVPVLNTGPVRADNAGAAVVLPEGIRVLSSTFVNGTKKGDCLPGEDRVIRCRFGTLEAGGSARLQIVVRPLRPGYLNLTAEPVADNAAATFESSVRTSIEVPEYCTVADTTNSGLLLGTPGRDVICSFDGNDRIYAMGGSDIVYGGPGNDLVYGGDGNDVVHGGRGLDTITGGAGKDQIYGARGQDILRVRDGVKGNDAAYGGPGRDTILADAKDRTRQ